MHAAAEAHRVLRPDGQWHIRIPHRRSPNATKDWSHKTTDWDRPKLEWITDPDAWHGLRFRLTHYREEAPARSRVTGRELGDWGNIHATLTKEGGA